MICEIVRFAVRPGTTREQVLEDARKVAPRWRAEENLIRKHFLFDGEAEALGIYLWKDRNSAEAAHDKDWRNRVTEIHGSEPSIEYHDTLMIVDNVTGTVTEYEP